MKLKMILATATVTAISALGVSQAAASTPSDVTIKGTNGDYYGKVKSADTDCLSDRTVNVYKQLGSSPSPKTDQKIGSDTTESNGDWSIGNSGFKHGSFYAKVKKTSECGADVSKVIVR